MGKAVEVSKNSPFLKKLCVFSTIKMDVLKYNLDYPDSLLIRSFRVTLDEHAYIFVFDPSDSNTGLTGKESENYVDNLKLNLRIRHLSSLLNN